MKEQQFIKRCEKCDRQFVGDHDETHCDKCKTDKKPPPRQIRVIP